MRLRTAPLILLVVCVALGGCASGKVREANDYVNAVNRAQASFSARSNAVIAQIGPDATSNRHHQVSRRLGALQQAVGGFEAGLRAIHPPARVQALHARLVAAVAQFAGRVRGAGADLASDDASRILDGQQRLAVAVGAMSRSVNTLLAQINAALKR